MFTSSRRGWPCSETSLWADLDEARLGFFCGDDNELQRLLGLVGDEGDRASGSFAYNGCTDWTLNIPSRRMNCIVSGGENGAV